MRWKHIGSLFLPVIMTLSVLNLIAGCTVQKVGLEKAVVRYQRLAIPGYARSHYEPLVFSKNMEVRYNALCNLIEHAPDYAQVLSRHPPEKSDESRGQAKGIDYQTAVNIYDTVRGYLYSSDTNLTTVALIFIQEFSSRYTNKEELVDIVLKVKATDKKTRFEQLKTLIVLSDSITSMDTRFVNGLLDSRSWLIRGTAYLLLGRIYSGDFHPKLIAIYKMAKTEFDKLLILQSFKNGFGPDVFQLFTNELAHSKSTPIKNAIADMLNMHNDDTAVVKWIILNHPKVGEETVRRIINSFQSMTNRKKGTDFLAHLLNSNQERLIKLVNTRKLFESFQEQKDEEKDPSHLAELEAAIMEHAELKRALGEFRQEELRERQREEKLEKSILPEFNKMLEKFLDDTKRMLSDQGMEEKEIEESTESIRLLLQDTVGEISD